MVFKPMMFVRIKKFTKAIIICERKTVSRLISETSAQLGPRIGISDKMSKNGRKQE